MIRRKGVYNSKRRIQLYPDPNFLTGLKNRIAYTGNPEHKRNPGDFVLSPPSSPRPDKTLCDTVGIFQRNVALKLLREGISKGFISIQTRGDFPQNVWVVTHQKEPLEAQLENEIKGTYHGYPMALDDPFRKVVMERWIADEE